MAEEPERAPEATPQTDVQETDAEKAARAAIPAVYIDTWFLTTWRGHIRITFGERVSRLDMYRSAIVMELRDAERLCNHMLEMINERKAMARDKTKG